eukprot:SAG11_NODE_1345_length_5147_cov_3.840729_8_plen_71_part_00
MRFDVTLVIAERSSPRDVHVCMDSRWWHSLLFRVARQGDHRHDRLLADRENLQATTNKLSCSEITSLMGD